MSYRATPFSTGRPGGVIEYRGDLEPPVTSYASATTQSPLTSRQRIPAASAWSGSAIVTRGLRRGGRGKGTEYFYSHGGYRMPVRVPTPGSSGVPSTRFQQVNVQLFDWVIVPSLYEAGYPRNLGLSSKVPQPNTNVTGGPGKSAMDQRPLFTKVQTVARAKAIVQAYATRGTKS
jgi:hypothetical protein